MRGALTVSRRFRRRNLIQKPFNMQGLQAKAAPEDKNRPKRT
jgi:hypothetical protein